jgi:hypothetical protein
MKVATKGDKPDWFDRPSGVVGANVCRVSGKLPNEGCTSVEVMDRDGLMETRSMVYTEYYLKGTQPTSLCPLHTPASLMDRLAGLFGGGRPEVPVVAEHVGLPAQSTGTAGAAAARPAPVPSLRPEEPPNPKAVETVKKRGFWSRIFGKGSDKKSDKDKKEDKNRN